MECIQAIKGRRSIRRFKDIPISRDMINQLLNAAQMAPSAGNIQARDFIIVSEKRLREQLAKAAFGQSFIEQAPIDIVVIANIERSSVRYGKRGELYAIQDATASIMNILLMAYSIGMGSCWVGAFDEDAIRILLGLHLINIRPIAIIPIGYPDETPITPPRLDLYKLTHLEMW